MQRFTGIAARISSLAIMAVEPIQSMLQPRISKNFTSGKVDLIKVDVIKSSMWIQLASITIIMLSLKFQKIFYFLFDSVYVEGTSDIIFLILLIGRFFASISSTAQSLALMCGHEQQQSRVMMLTVFIIYPALLFIGAAIGEIVGVQLLLLLPG